MADALAKPMTLRSFLAWEERQDLRYEFDGFQPIGMTYAQARIKANLLRALGNRLDGTPCTAVGSELKVQTATGVRYPDVFIIRAPMPLDATLARDPVVIFEILSPSTANDDLGEKKPNIRLSRPSKAMSCCNRRMDRRKLSVGSPRRPPMTGQPAVGRSNASPGPRQ